MKMSKLFKISGNFTEGGDWIAPAFAFEGEIAVNHEGKFYGWCEQAFIEGVSSQEEAVQRDADKVRSLVGALAEEGDGYSLMFFKLSNDTWQTPLLYEFHSASAADSIWSAEDPGGGFVPWGNAQIYLTEIPYSDAAATHIKDRFGETDISISRNDTLIREVDSWQSKNLVLWTN